MIDNYYTIKAGKKLRYGYTTGSCAAAAAKAACLMLFSQTPVSSIDIETPKGIALHLNVHDEEITDDYAQCSIIKDAGDDPDVTDGMKIFARVEKNNDSRITIKGGPGVGTVTKKGLAVKPGNPAINPGPREMIKAEVRKVLPEGEGITITIYAPAGIEIAKKTFNPYLGITGGISILGTTGIVEPKSEEAYKQSLSLKLSVLQQQGITTLAFVPGNYGENFLTTHYSTKKDYIVHTGNYVGYMLDHAHYYGIKRLLITGHIGKLIKVAGGIFNTYSKIADARLEILAANYAYYCRDLDGATRIMESNTTEEAVEYIDNKDFFTHIVDKIRTHCLRRIDHTFPIEIMLFSMNKGLLAMTPGATEITDLLRDQDMNSM